jgi:hypothetical protein
MRIGVTNVSDLSDFYNMQNNFVLLGDLSLDLYVVLAYIIVSFNTALKICKCDKENDKGRQQDF